MFIAKQPQPHSLDAGLAVVPHEQDDPAAKRSDGPPAAGEPPPAEPHITSGPLSQLAEQYLKMAQDAAAAVQPGAIDPAVAQKLHEFSEAVNRLVAAAQEVEQGHFGLGSAILRSRVALVEHYNREGELEGRPQGAIQHEIEGLDELHSILGLEGRDSSEGPRGPIEAAEAAEAPRAAPEEEAKVSISEARSLGRAVAKIPLDPVRLTSLLEELEKVGYASTAAGFDNDIGLEAAFTFRCGLVRKSIFQLHESIKERGAGVGTAFIQAGLDSVAREVNGLADVIEQSRDLKNPETARRYLGFTKTRLMGVYRAAQLRADVLALDAAAS